MSGTNEGVILTYHSVSRGPAPLCISPASFADQMSWLKANARVIDLGELVNALARGEPLPPRTVALTFDDGFQDFYAEAAPALRRLGLTATVFLPAAFCGRVASWNAQAGALPLMAWKHVRELAAQGLSFGSHGMSHAVLVNLTDAELAYEVGESKRLIEAESGQNVNFFCYPYGRFDERARQAANAHYSGGACSTELRTMVSGDDRFAVPRLDVHYLRHFTVFRSLFTEGFRFYLGIRRIARTLRSRACAR